MVGTAITQRILGQNAAALMTLVRANHWLVSDPQADKFVEITIQGVSASILWQAGNPEKAKHGTESLIGDALHRFGPNHPLVL